MVTEAEVIRQFLDLQYGSDKGTAWISVGSGADAVRTFSDNPFQWPEQAQEVVEFIVAQNEAGYNVWYAAHLSYSKAPKPTGSVDQIPQLDEDDGVLLADDLDLQLVPVLRALERDLRCLVHRVDDVFSLHVRHSFP